MKLLILIPDGKVAEATVNAVTLPGAAGQLTPMTGHDRLLTPLIAGALYFTRDGKREAYQLAAGFAEIRSDGVTVFTTKATKASET